MHPIKLNEASVELNLHGSQKKWDFISEGTLSGYSSGLTMYFYAACFCNVSLTSGRWREHADSYGNCASTGKQWEGCLHNGTAVCCVQMCFVCVCVCVHVNLNVQIPDICILCACISICLYVFAYISQLSVWTCVYAYRWM